MRRPGRPARRADPAIRSLDLQVVAAVVLTLAGLGVRWQYRSVQSYWTDELFSVDQAHRPALRSVLRLGLTEVHTPLFAVLLHGWIRAGGTYQTAWVRTLPVLLGAAAVVACYALLRGVGLSREARWLCVAATSTSGFLVVYSQEVRPYALLMLGAVGVTAVSLRRWLRATGPAGGWRRWWSWTAWALLAATAHLLGVVLVAVLAGMLLARAVTARRAREALTIAAGAAVAIAPQAAWIVVGSHRAGFAAGTDWIRAAGAKDVAALVLSTFGAGGLAARPDGFAWTAPWGVVFVAGLLLVAVAAALGPCRAPAVRTVADGADDADVAAARFLLAGAVLVCLATFGISQVVHLWTLRNMIVVVPALLWGTGCLITGLPRGVRGRRLVFAIALSGLAASLVVTAHDVARPYKPDFRTAVRYLIAVRYRDPDATFVVLAAQVPRRELLAADLPADDPAVRHAFDRVMVYPRSVDSIARLPRTPGTEVILYYDDVSGRDDAARRAAVLARLGAGCSPVPVHGVVMVACVPEHQPGRDLP